MEKVKYDVVGGRKFILGVACLVTETVLLCVGMVTAIVFKEMFLITLAMVLGGNVAQKIWSKDKKKVEETDASCV